MVPKRLVYYPPHLVLCVCAEWCLFILSNQTEGWNQIKYTEFQALEKCLHLEHSLIGIDFLLFSWSNKNKFQIIILEDYDKPKVWLFISKLQFESPINSLSFILCSGGLICRNLSETRLSYIFCYTGANSLSILVL